MEAIFTILPPWPCAIICCAARCMQKNTPLAFTRWMRSQSASVTSMMFTQKRHLKPMTPYKSMSKWVCDRMGTQEYHTHGYFPPLQSMVCYDCHYLCALLCHAPVSRDARHLEKPPSPPPLLAGLHASPVSRAENLGRACPLDAGLDHGLALAPRPQSGLLESPSAGRVVGPRKLSQ